jgi:pyruvate kinase
LFADGGISSTVKKIENGIVTVVIQNDGKLGSKKNMCLPGRKVTLPTICDYDEHDIVEFGLRHRVDYIAVSFARYRTDLTDLRKYLIAKDPEHGPNVHLISKIENHEAIENIDEIIDGSDGIMVARGDLGMEVPIEKVVMMQKYIMGKTIDAGKYVICATQMLESMESKPRPTRAEVSDITNAVLDLTDGLMTSGETTNGLFPTECARMLRKVDFKPHRLPRRPSSPSTTNGSSSTRSSSSRRTSKPWEPSLCPSRWWLTSSSLKPKTSSSSTSSRLSDPEPTSAFSVTTPPSKD